LVQVENVNYPSTFPDRVGRCRQMGCGFGFVAKSGLSINEVLERLAINIEREVLCPCLSKAMVAEQRVNV